MSNQRPLFDPSKPPLPATVILAVRNEAAQLATLLPSLTVFARVVVVESIDDPATRELCCSHGADFTVFEWKGGYPKKRTWAMRSCDIRTPWTLFLDADERVTPDFLAELGNVLPLSIVNGFWLTYDTVFLGRRLRFGVPQRKLALVRTGSGEYEQINDQGWTDLDMEIHEHLVVKGSTGAIRARLVHLDAKSIDAYVKRHNAYASWEAQRYAALRLSHDAWKSLTFRQRLKYSLVASPFFPIAYFFLQYVLKLGVCDGATGLRFALLKSGYFAEVGAKIAELRLGKVAPQPGHKPIAARVTS